MWHAARRAGLCVGRDQVGRLMRIAGIQGVRRGAHRTVTTVRDDRALRHPALVKRGWKTSNRPDAVWVADFTYVRAVRGFCYVLLTWNLTSGWIVTDRHRNHVVRGPVARERGGEAALGRHERAAEWLGIWTNLGRAPRTIDAYARACGKAAVSATASIR